MDNLEFGLRISLLGFSTVIITLFILYVVLSMFSRLSNTAPQGNDDMMPGAGVIDGENGISPVTVAALTAAVTRYLELTGMHGKPLAVTVESARETPRNGWADAGRRVMMEGKLELERLRRKNNR